MLLSAFHQNKYKSTTTIIILPVLMAPNSKKKPVQIFKLSVYLCYKAAIRFECTDRKFILSSLPIIIKLLKKLFIELMIFEFVMNHSYMTLNKHYVCQYK